MKLNHNKTLSYTIIIINHEARVKALTMLENKELSHTVDRKKHMVKNIGESQ